MKPGAVGTVTFGGARTPSWCSSFTNRLALKLRRNFSHVIVVDAYLEMENSRASANLDDASQWLTEDLCREEH